jgi:hypothetical protein
MVDTNDEWITKNRIKEEFWKTRIKEHLLAIKARKTYYLNQMSIP